MDSSKIITEDDTEVGPQRDQSMDAFEAFKRRKLAEGARVVSADEAYEAFKRRKGLGAANDEQEAENSEEEPEEEEQWAELEEFDMYEVLKLTRPEKGSSISGGDARIRGAFHRLSQRWHPENFPGTDDEFEETELKFRQISLAFSVLKDEERRRIYTDLGWDAIKKSEKFQETNVFELDPYDIYADFFAGVDEADRDYLLMNGPQHLSDEEDEDEDEEEAEIPVGDDLVGTVQESNLARFKELDSPPPPPVNPEKVSSVLTALSSVAAVVPSASQVAAAGSSERAKPKKR